ncbi:hypothetical protein H0X06_00735 [Candidatus Dependentiae bacterium]|nr:hypothetical protein [Candidatus Dependentiae bacterium]
MNFTKKLVLTALSTIGLVNFSSECMDKTVTTMQINSESCPICLETFSNKCLPLQFNCSTTKDGYSQPHTLCLACTKKLTETSTLCPLCRNELEFFDPHTHSKNIHPQANPSLYYDLEAWKNLDSIRTVIPASVFLCTKEAWKFEHAKTLFEHNDSIGKIVFSPDKKIVLTGPTLYSHNKNIVYVWDTCTEKLITQLKGSFNTITSLAFSFDGRMILVGGDDGTVQLYHSNTGEIIKQLKQESVVSSVGSSPDGTMIITGSWDSKISVWDFQTGTLIKELQGNSPLISVALFSPDSSLIIAVHSTNTVYVWNTQTFELINQLDKKGLTQQSHKSIILSGSDGKTIEGMMFVPEKIWAALPL